MSESAGGSSGADDRETIGGADAGGEGAAPASVPIERWSSERIWLGVVAVAALGVWLALVASLTGVIVGLLLGLLLALGRARYQAALRGGALRVGPHQSAELWHRVETLSGRLGLDPPPETLLRPERFAWDGTATRWLRPAPIVLCQDELDRCADDAPARDFLIARALARRAAGHGRGFALLWPGLLIPGLGQAYWRACALTADRCAARACEDRAAASRALACIAAGPAVDVDRDRLAAQRGDLESASMQLGLWLRAEPATVLRIAALESETQATGPLAVRLRAAALAASAVLAVGFLTSLYGRIESVRQDEARAVVGVDREAVAAVDGAVDGEVDGELADVVHNRAGDPPRGAPGPAAQQASGAEVVAPDGIPGLAQTLAREPSPFELAMDEALLAVFAHDEFERRAESLGEIEARALAASLIARGQLRLPDEDLTTRTRLMSVVLEIADPTTCAAIMRGEASGALERDQLSDADAHAWAQLSARAALLELDAAPRPSPAEPVAIELAFAALLGSLDPETGERLGRGLSDLGGLDDDEACWVARTLYRGVQGLGPAEGAILARALAQ